MTPEQRVEYAAILSNPPYPNNRISLYQKKRNGCTVCAIGAIYCVKVQDPFRSRIYLTTDECARKLNIVGNELDIFMRLNCWGGYQAVIDWLLTGLDISNPKEPDAPTSSQ